MLLETLVVSRKTPRDGKLDISVAAAARLGRLRPDLRVLALGREGAASTETFTCTCGKRGGGSHIHHFLASELFKGLAEGAEVTLELDEGTRRLTVATRRAEGGR
jgi:hypothetical protein